MTETDTLYEALHAVQGKLPHLQKTKLNPAFRSKYVPLEQVHEEVLPILNEHELVWVTRPALDGEGRPCLNYALIHVGSGDAIEGTMALLLDKQSPQGQGSAITYARRYALMAVLGLVADEDDDGNAGSGKGKPARKANAKPASKPAAKPADGKVTPETLAAIKDLYQSSGLKPEGLAEVLAGAGVTAGTSMSDLPEEKAQWVLVALRERVETPAETPAK